jgi:hypothetical protein
MEIHIKDNFPQRVFPMAMVFCKVQLADTDTVGHL